MKLHASDPVYSIGITEPGLKRVVHRLYANELFTLVFSNGLFDTFNNNSFVLRD
jgi:hypothetical protein